MKYIFNDYNQYICAHNDTQILIHEGPQSKSIRACIPAYKVTVKIPAGNAPQPA